MIRYFCDCCGKEISERDTNTRNPLGRLSAMLKRGNSELAVEVIETKDGTSNAGNFCRYCVLDALAKLDDRPQPARRADLYSELAEALGCDPLDSHDGRLARARRLASAA